MGTGTLGIPQWCREVTCMRYQLAVQNFVYLQWVCLVHARSKQVESRFDSDQSTFFYWEYTQ